MNNPKVTVNLDAQALAEIHSMTRRVRDALAKDGIDATDLRDLCLTIEGALRSHGWRPANDGTWTR